MLENWRNWCRFCAKMDSSSSGVDTIPDSIRKQIDLVSKCFGIAISPIDGPLCSICKECTDFVTNLANFKDQYMNVVQMFRELILQENLTHSDLQSIRLKHGVDKEEIKYSTFLIEPDNIKTSREGSVISDQLPDPLDVNVVIPAEITKLDDEKSEKSTSPSGVPEKGEEPIKSVQCQNASQPEIKQEDVEDEFGDSNTVLHDSSTVIKDKAERWRGPRSAREKPNICEFCSKKYSRKYLLKLHIREKHSKEELPFPCSKCSKRFVSLKKQQLHEILHLPNDERLIHPCSYCDKKFSTANNVQSHIRTVHIGGKPFVCEECGKCFKSKSKMTEHQISHSDERSFQCSYCPKKYKNQARVKRHEEVHSSTTYDCPHCGVKKSTKKTLRLHMVVHSDIKKYKCNYCGNEYKRAKALKEHIFLHTGQRPYECPFCDKTFASGANCRGHKRKAHATELAAMMESGVEQKSVVLPRLEYLQSRSIAGVDPEADSDTSNQ